MRLAGQHQKVANQRQDFLHQTSHRLVDRFGLIKIENPNVCGMLKNHHLAKSIADSGWCRFGTFLDYKGQWYGSHIERVDRSFPSSKTCSVCGWLNQDLQLQHRFWICQDCNTLHDRDLNAAVNIERHVPAERRERITPVESASPTLGVQPLGLVETGSTVLKHCAPFNGARDCPLKGLYLNNGTRTTQQALGDGITWGLKPADKSSATGTMLG